MTKSTVERTVGLLEDLIGDLDINFPVSLMNTNLDVYAVTPNDVFYDYELSNDKLERLREKLSAQADMENRIPITVSVIFDIPYVDKNTISIVDDKHKLTAMVNTTAVLDGYDPTYIGTTRLGTYVPELVLANNVMNAEFTVIDPSTNIWVENVVPMQVVGDPSNPADRVEADYSDGSSGFGISLDIFASEAFDTSKGVDICISTSFGDRFDLSTAEVETLSRDGGLRVFWYLGVLDPTANTIWTNDRIDIDVKVNCSQEATAVILPTYVDETGGGSVSQHDAYRDNKGTVSIFRAVAGTDNVYINYDDLFVD
jgi:hypothetical protein